MTPYYDHPTIITLYDHPTIYTLLQPRITYARPHYVVASQLTTVTLKGTHLPSPNGLTLRTGPSASETIMLGETATVRMRSCATHELLQTLEPVLGQVSRVSCEE